MNKSLTEYRTCELGAVREHAENAAYRYRKAPNASHVEAYYQARVEAARRMRNSRPFQRA